MTTNLEGSQSKEMILYVSHELPFVIRQCIYESTTSG